MEIITNRKKWHEKRGLNLKIKVTSENFGGQETLSYVVATKLSHKFNFRNFSIFLVSKGDPTMLKKYSMRNVFFENHTQNKVEKFPDLFLKNKI